MELENYQTKLKEKGYSHIQNHYKSVYNVNDVQNSGSEHYVSMDI